MVNRFPALKALFPGLRRCLTLTMSNTNHYCSSQPPQEAMTASSMALTGCAPGSFTELPISRTSKRWTVFEYTFVTVDRVIGKLSRYFGPLRGIRVPRKGSWIIAFVLSIPSLTVFSDVTENCAKPSCEPNVTRHIMQTGGAGINVLMRGHSFD